MSRPRGKPRLAGDRFQGSNQLSSEIQEFPTSQPESNKRSKMGDGAGPWYINQAGFNVLMNKSECLRAGPFRKVHSAKVIRQRSIRQRSIRHLRLGWALA
jgi:hypothetical protein